MNKTVIYIMLTLFCFACNNNKNKNITMVDGNGIEWGPEMMYFKTEKEGYVFSSSIHFNGAKIFYSKDGGYNWQQIHYEIGHTFYKQLIVCFKNSIFGFIASTEKSTKNNLFKFDLTTQEFKLLDFNIEAIGNIWVQNDSICMSLSNKNLNSNKWEGKVLSVNTDFQSYSIVPFYYLEQSEGVVSDSVNTYFITWKNQLVIDTDGKYQEVAINNPTCITKIAENKVLIATNERENAINLYQYDLTNDKLEKMQTFENYSIINHFQSNEKVIIGFVGNIKGMFVEYDLIYSTDKGQTWHIQKLKDRLMISPNCLVDNILYIYSGRKLQKVVF